MDRAVALATLNVSPDATEREIRSAYKRRAFETHPDRAGGSSSAFRDVTEAYRVLCEPASLAPYDGAVSTHGEASSVPPTDAARTLFEYLSDLASDMILNGATPEAVAAFLADEGCPPSVARALEQDLRARVQAAADAVQPVDAPPAAPPEAPPPPAGAAEPRVPSPRRPAPGAKAWAAGCAAIALVAAGVAIAAPWRGKGTVPEPPRSESPRREPPPAAPPPATSAPRPPARATAPAPKASSPHPRLHDAPAPRRTASVAQQPGALGAESAALDLDRKTLERDQQAFAADVSALEAEQRRIEAARADAAVQADPLEVAKLRRQEAAYGDRLAQARRQEKALGERVRALNARIAAYNERVRAGR